MTKPDRLRAPARIIAAPPLETVSRWIKAGLADFSARPLRSLLHGGLLALFGWAVFGGLALAGYGWMILPALAGAMMLGPAATVALYRISRRRAGFTGDGAAATGQIFIAGVVMMVLALLWVRAATLLFAVFFGLRPFAGLFETLITLFTTTEGVALFVTGSAVGGLFAALGFAIAAFSFPMLIHRDVDGFSAMALSFNAATRNFRLAVAWGATVSFLIALSLLTGLLALIPVFPLLGYATWHAYADLFESPPHD